MFDDYKKCVGVQHAPVQLIESTLEKIHNTPAAKIKANHSYFSMRKVAAAIMVVTLLTAAAGAQIMKKNNQIDFMVMEDTVVDSGLEFGAIHVKRSIQDIILENGISVILEIYENPAFPTEQYQKGKAVKLECLNVYFSEDHANYYAAYQKDEQTFLIKSDKTDKDTFVQAVKKFLKN